MSKAFILILAAGYVGWGTVQTLLLKYADLLHTSDNFNYAAIASEENSCVPYYNENNNGKPECLPIYIRIYYSFAHPFTQAFFMFCAEASCLAVYYILFYWKKRKMVSNENNNSEEDEKNGFILGKDIAKPHNSLVYFLSGGADFFASIIQNVGMTMTHASLYQMLRGATIVYICILSRFWLKRRYTKVELFGMSLVMLGLTCVGLSSLTKKSNSPEHNENVSRQLVGNFLVLSAQALHAYQGVCEERLSKLYNIPPLMLVGMEGIYGIGMSLILLTVLQFSPMISVTHNIVKMEEYSPVFSSFSKNENNNDYVWQQLADTSASQWTNSIQNKTQIESYFVNNHHNNFNVPFDDILLTFRQLFFSSACFFTILFYILAGAFYNFCQISIIKHLSAGAAVMMGSLRNISVWCVCLVLPIFGESFNIIQFLGFIGLVVGNIFFQNVWIKTFDEILPKNVVDRFSFFLKDYEKASDVMITEEMEMTEDARKDSTTEVLPF